MIAAVIWASEIASIVTPVDQMYAVSPLATPLSMMSAFSRGRYSDAIAEMNWKISTPSKSQRYCCR